MRKAILLAAAITLGSACFSHAARPSTDYKVTIAVAPYESSTQGLYWKSTVKIRDENAGAYLYTFSEDDSLRETLCTADISEFTLSNDQAEQSSSIYCKYPTYYEAFESGFYLAHKLGATLQGVVAVDFSKTTFATSQGSVLTLTAPDNVCSAPCPECPTDPGCPDPVVVDLTEITSQLEQLNDTTEALGSQAGAIGERIDEQASYLGDKIDTAAGMVIDSTEPEPEPECAWWDFHCWHSN